MSPASRKDRKSGSAGPPSVPRRNGVVVESYGRRVMVRFADDGERVACKLRGRKVELVAGDEVALEADRASHGAETWVVVERLPRRNVLQRTDSRGLDEALVANLDQLGIVVAPRPASDPFLIDRYLAGAGYADIPVLLILNKRDLLESDSFVPGAEFGYLAVYRKLDIPLVAVSAKQRTGLDTLIEQLRGRRTLLAGQSGVGKSSLTNALGATLRATSELSEASGEGRHTTVSSAILSLPWGELTDSPGVRDYAPPVVPLKEVQRGFKEILRASAGCRFQDCLHLREPQCAVQAATATGDIDPRRVESYRRLVNLTRQLDEKRGWRA